MLEPWQWPVALGLAAGAGLLSGVSGFGAGLLMSAYLLPVLGAQLAVPVLAVTMCVTNLGRLWAFRTALAWRPASLVLAGCLPAALLGTGLFARLSGAAADLAVGLFLLASVPLRRALRGRQGLGSPAGLLAGGIVTGLLSGVSTGAGILIIPLLLGAGLSGGGLLATDSFVSAAMHAARSLGYAWNGLLGWDLLLLGIALGAATVPGSRAAAWVVQRLSPRIHTLWLEALVAAVGGVTALFALRTLLG